MVEQARLALPQNGVNQIEFIQGPAEDLSILPDSSVDLLIAGSLPSILKLLADRSPCNVQPSPLTGSTGIRYGQKLRGF